MGKDVQIYYEKIEDILYIGKKEKVKFSIDVALPSGDVIVDFGFDGKINGIEIFNASEFFSMVPSDIVKIKKAYFNVLYAPSYTSINISLEKEKNGAPIKTNLIVPYNKKLILA